MAKHTIAHQGKAGEQPVRSGIHRAAKRIGLEPAETSADELDRTDEELDALRNLVQVAEGVFEHDGESSAPVALLREALRSARADFDLLGDASGCGSALGGLTFIRCVRRIDLALALAEYRESFGYIESDNERKVREQFEAAEARAAGGKS
jgi:hypothetical protein